MTTDDVSGLPPTYMHAYLTSDGEIYVAVRRVPEPPNHGMRPGAWYLMVRKDEHDAGIDDDFYWIHADGSVPNELRGLELVADLGASEHLPLVDASGYEALRARLVGEYARGGLSVPWVGV